MSPGFFGLFSKRGSSKSLRTASTPGSPHPRPKSPAGIPLTSTAKDNTSPSIADNSETLEGSQLSLDTDYVLADADSPPPLPAKVAYPIASSSSASGASSSTTKLKIPFRRKQSTSSKLSTTTAQSSVPPVPATKELHKFSIDSSLSDSPSLHPPPSRSVIFGSHADPHNTLSTRSLPQDSPFTHSRQDSADTARNYETMSNPDSHMPSYSPLHPPKPSSKGGLFAWARPRGRTKSKPSTPAPPSLQPQSSTPPPPADSFNLKSFRHVTPSLSTSPNPDSPPLDTLDPPVRPRPRGDSFASDSSQRISVAAFREVQARRSATNSPVPSLPGDRDSGVASGQVRSRKRSSTLGTPPPLLNTGSQPRLPVARSPPPRSSTAPLFLSVGMTSSESSEEEESDSDDEEEATLRPNRKRTVTSRSTGGTQSELGHRTSPVAAISSARSDVGHGVHPASPSRLAAPSSQHPPSLDDPGESSRASSVYSRARASVSASALVPEAAVNRASMISGQSVDSKLTQPTRTQSRASTSSEESSSSSSSSSSEDAPLASLLPPPRPGSAMSRASGSPGRRPTKPLIDIGELVGGHTAPPIRTPEQSKDSSQASKEDPPLLRPRKASFGIGERLSALASGISGSQPSRPKSPESASDSKDEAFTPPVVPEKPRPQSPALSTRTSPPPRSQTSPALMPKGPKSSPGGIRLKPSGGFKIDTSPLKLDSTYSPPPSSSASSDAPIPHITPTPIRERQEPPAFTVTSRPTSHATNLSVGTLAALDNAIAETNNKQGPRAAASATADQARRNQQRQSQQQQQDPQTTVRVVRSVPPKPSREESLPVPRPQQRPRVASANVTVSNIRVTPPPSSASSTPSVPRYGASGGSMVPLPKPFALRDSSPASSAGESSSSRMPATPRDGSDLGVGRSGRPGRYGPDHRKQRASVTFVDQVEGNERDARRSNIAPRQSHGPVVAADSSDEEATLRDRERQAEEKRKERRRGEAKAAIELGKVINGTGPIDDDDDDDNGEDDEDDDRPMNVPPRMSMAMGMGMGMSRNVPFPSAPMGFQGQWPASASAPQPFANQFSGQSMQNLLGANAGAGMNMAAGMNMNPNMNMGGAGMGMVDPRMLMAHQQAMMIAKQTYQLAVAQQAMRDAADEWERGSAVSGWGGGSGRSSIAAPSVLGMGMNMGMNMNGNLGVGPFGMPPGAWPAGGGGSAARSMYAGSVYATSDIGVPSGSGAMGWSTTNSVYGESFGAPRDRSSRAFRQGPGQQQHGTQARESGGGTSGAAKREGARQRTRTAPSSGSGQQLRASAGAGGGAGVKRRGEAPGLIGAVSPPSSWKGAS
ncbi:hypothetical protein EDB83DRAFT_2517874 [Lactarius deliciosus]|nr:hypothetical protein EDB83DRAFT_2517874 [Lactarius deliciosus]